MNTPTSDSNAGHHAVTKQLRMVDPKPEHLAVIWANLAADDKHALAAGAFPPTGPEDLAAWSVAGCTTSGVVLLDGRPIAYAGITAHPGVDYLIPWAITVERMGMGMTKRQTVQAAIAAWEALRVRTTERLGGSKADYVSYLNITPVNHKRSRALLPFLGFTFTGRTWVAPSGVEFEFFRMPTSV